MWINWEIKTGQRKIRFFSKDGCGLRMRSELPFSHVLARYSDELCHRLPPCPILMSRSLTQPEAPVQGPTGYPLLSSCSAPSSCGRAGAPPSFEDESLVGLDWPPSVPVGGGIRSVVIIAMIDQPHNVLSRTV